MPYNKTTWVNNQPPSINATRLNNLESQYDAVAADVGDGATPVGAALNSTYARPLTNTVVLFGTSLESQNGAGANVTDPTATDTVNARGWFNWFNAYTLDSFTLVHNAGVGGNTYAQMLARISTDVLAYESDWVFIGGPTNDISQGRTTAQIVADLDTILDTLAGRRVLLLTAPPNGGYDSTAELGVLYEVNAHISALPTVRANVVVVDVYKLLANIATSAPATGMAVDTVHYSNAGALLVGRAAAEAMNARYSPVVARSAAANDPKGVLSNPLATGGTGWSVAGNGSGGASVAASYVARADGFGFSADITVSGATVDDTYGIEALENIAVGRFSVGDVVWGEATIEWSGATMLGVVSQLGPRVRLRSRLAAGAFTDELFAPFMASSQRTIPARFPSSGKVRLRTPRITIDSGVDRLYLGTFMQGIAAASIKVTDANIYRL